jgi:glycosyltransferase involved in cell wall biosynthesis
MRLSLRMGISEKEFEFRFHPVRSKGFFRNRIFLQTGIKIPSHFQKGDVLVISGNPRYLSNYPIVFVARRRGLGIIWWGHGYTAGSRGWTVTVRKRIMRIADVVLLYTDKEVDDYRRAKFPSDRLFAINNTIDNSEIDYAKEKWTALLLHAFQKKHGLKSGKTVLFCGRITPKAKLRLALEALAILRRKDAAYRLIIIGDGPGRRSLVALAKKLNIHNAVYWLGAIYDQMEVAPWFLSASAFIYPGSIGLSLLHAFAFGLPVITHDTTELHMPEFAALNNGVNGLLFRYDDALDLASQIGILANDNGKLIRMKANALETVRSKFSFNGMVERFVKAVTTAALIAGNKR